MQRPALTKILSGILIALLASPAFSPLSAESASTLGRVVFLAPATVNGVAMPSEATLFSGDRVATGAHGAARVFLTRGQQVHLTDRSEARLQAQGERLRLELFSGTALLRTADGNFEVRVSGMAIAPAGDGAAVWQVSRLSETSVLVSATQGSLTARTAAETRVVSPGKSVRLESPPTADASSATADQGNELGILTLEGGATKAAAMVLAILIPILMTNDPGEPVSPAGL
jgi:ferric-dicitrate binding protein FerR (iron transport regulator)